MGQSTQTPRILVIGAGIGGLTSGALLAKSGYEVTVLEAGTYAGGCAGTFYHQGYRFDAGATLAGGFQPNGPHALVAEKLGIEWPIKPAETAWTVHLVNEAIHLSKNQAELLNHFPEAEGFWAEQNQVADLSWSMTAQGLPFPPTSLSELSKLTRVGLNHFPADLRLTQFAFSTVRDWLARHDLDENKRFKRFIDAQLLISAQTTSDHTNALYGATALDLARQGVQHVVGGMGGLAEKLMTTIRDLGGQVLLRHKVRQIDIRNGRAVGVFTQHGRRAGDYFPADVIIANLTPWALDALLGKFSPTQLRREVKHREASWGAFVLHLGIQDDNLPKSADHHQIIPSLEGELDEGNSIFVSISPDWDTRRAPVGHRAVTVTTHTHVQMWWDLLQADGDAYQIRKNEYAAQMIQHISQVLPGFRENIVLSLPGTPVTYEFYTRRPLGMVGGFPQQSLWQARSPRVGVPNIRLVGDSIFPGQSTAGVTVGAMRVVEDVEHLITKPRLSRIALF